jgi:hypothetical protein
VVRRPAARRPGARPAGPQRRGARPFGGPAAVFLVLIGLFVTGCGLGLTTGPLSLPDFGLDGFGFDEPAEAGGAEALGASPPIRIRIPSIEVRAPVHRVGLAADGSIGVPPVEKHDETGWYERGPAPGQLGPAIIVGHVDTRGGPSVFHDLPRLRKGSRIEVTRKDRRVAVFEVTSVERFNKARLPADRVYGDYQRPGLRLITCGGRWLGSSRGYADNVIVFASLVDTHRA